jgi:di/tricarboxylate transporter
MYQQLAIVLALLAAAIVMFAINKPRMDAVALIMLTALPLAGVVTVNEALAGFSDPNIVLIAALFVIGDGLVRTGVAQRLGDWLNARAGSNPTTLLVLLMIVVCALGATMSSTAVTAIFIPVALRIARNTGTSPSQLMMPISVAALISGMTTLIATAPNLVVSSELERQGAAGFSFFAFTPFGVPILVVAIGYMLFARRWLGGGGDEQKGQTLRRPSLADWVEQYQLAGREFRVGVTQESPFVGKTIEEIRKSHHYDATLIGIERGGKLIQPTQNTMIFAGDILLVDFQSEGADIEPILRDLALERMPLSGLYFTDRSQDIGMAEAIVPPDSDFIGKTVVDARFRDRTGLSVIGLRRGREALARNPRDEKLKLGDTLLLIGSWNAIQNLPSDSRGLAIITLPSEVQEVLPAPGKALPAVLCLALVIGLMVSGVVPNVLAALIGCLLMKAFGCVNLNSAYRAIDWKTIVLIVGMLPFSIALQKTGGVELAANALMSAIGDAGPRAVLASIFAITAVLGMFISNTATAVLMAPVALAIARDTGRSPYPFAMIVALAASTAFMTPVSSPVNTLVVTPGNYRFGDFVRVGVPLAIMVMILCVAMVPWLLPL